MTVFNLKKKSQVETFINPNLPMDLQIREIVKNLVNAGIKTENVEGYIRQMTNLEMTIPRMREMAEAIQEAQEEKERVEVDMGVPGISTEEIGMEKIEKKETFNLLKRAQIDFTPEQPPMDDLDLNDTPELMEDQTGIRTIEEGPNFQDGSDLKDWLDQRDFVLARNNLLHYVGDIQSQQTIEDALGAYYETDLDRNERLKLATGIFELLPDNLKMPDVNEESTVMAPRVRACVEETSKMIARLAKDKFGKKSKTEKFNLKKTAQHQSLQNAIIWGPSEKPIIDPFYRMPVSDWHIVERNKGWGQDIGGIWNIDYETLWRTHIMDKYSRPYRNKKGEWVGGYIQKRFEVDKNIPEASNYQLKPGQRRKVRLPEYGVIEGRLQTARAEGSIEGGPVVNNSEPFNWKEAQTKKKI